MTLRIGVDIVGTFTYQVALDEGTGAVVNTNALRTQRDLLDGVLRCVDQTGVRQSESAGADCGETVSTISVAPSSSNAGTTANAASSDCP